MGRCLEQQFARFLYHNRKKEVKILASLTIDIIFNFYFPRSALQNTVIPCLLDIKGNTTIWKVIFKGTQAMSLRINAYFYNWTSTTGMNRYIPAIEVRIKWRACFSGCSAGLTGQWLLKGLSPAVSHRKFSAAQGQAHPYRHRNSVLFLPWGSLATGMRTYPNQVTSKNLRAEVGIHLR